MDDRKIESLTSGARIIWVPQGQVPFYSEDRGTTWVASTGAPAGAMKGTTIFQCFNQPLAADRVDSNIFYLYKSGRFYRSSDGSTTWAEVSSLPDSGDWHTIQAAPGMKGEVWAGLDSSGIYRSSNSGDTFTRIQKVQRARLMAFGKAAPGRSNPAVFVYGRVENNDGIFRSDDMGATWVAIGDSKVPIGNEPNTMAGDRQVFGRVYIGTNGRGIYYGQLLE
ncbi:MAG TPA: hypothetical protein VE954_24870 [Oligoflexus sp.]|uniref:WD40/YVTN/BNR-like repeat-containing protein n=1 Tax=Oligoflexus sp. TaxID=1971216 RepID=UPI002D601683|nr:hypothetical protein [Oligoflexus sp.]HYX36351.1 hypothetical protein [Oligoflexus sp.]